MTQSFTHWLGERVLHGCAQFFEVVCQQVARGSVLQRFRPWAGKPALQGLAWGFLVLAILGQYGMLFFPDAFLAKGKAFYEVMLYAGFFMLALHNATRGLMILLFLLPLFTYRPLLVLLTFLLLSIVFNGVTQKRLLAALNNRFHVGVGVFLFFFLLTSLASPGIKESLSHYFLYYVVSFVLYGVIVFLIQTPGDLKRATLALVLGAFLISLYGIYQYLTLEYTSLKWVDVRSNPLLSKRAFATFENPNSFAQYLVLIIPLAFVLLWQSHSWMLRFRYAVMFGGLCLALVLTFSRGAWLALFLGGSVLALLISRRLFLIGLIAGAIGLNFLPDVVLDRIASIFDAHDSSSTYRFLAWKAAFSMIRDFWLTGIGADSQTFLHVYADYMINDVRVFHFHNIYLHHFVMGGILGISGVIFLFYNSFKRLVQVMFSADGALGYIHLMAKGLFASILALSIAGLTEDVWRQYRVDFAFWAVLALGAATYGFATRGEYADEE
ncbi:O-antigen ligase family protein [Calditerricola satsumensis]|uniref:O-antigen ligase family protein n=1 Tax=Calditerricola satsumensis TaxID=373054 RepID=UPI0006D10B9E|nr:O-antigen ligase family protein [Calditerricola satsumensis]